MVVEHFVTIFDSLFLPQGLALHMSMERHVRHYILWILCVDDDVYDVLGRLNLVNVRRLKLSDLETPELRKVKPGRTIGEYCWTLTPFAPRFVFEADPTVERVTYLDADISFRKHPKPIFDELDASAKHVLITDHAYAPENDQSATSGQYCVQFITFIRGGGEIVRKWWEERCLEWCFARFEDGKFGDQKYLDNWTEIFGDVVHVLREKELVLAPWNASRFPFGNAIFFHFHGLRLISRSKIYMGDYLIPDVLRERVYLPYFRDFQKGLIQLEEIGFIAVTQLKPMSFARRCYKKLLFLYAMIKPLVTDNVQKL
ncbi:cephalosporin hydroxylase family protein [Gammaproteobacteria bacterium]|nr:cephalosporin hydroxylase family protein [Gammaproteobacteria bacterium]